MTIICVGAHPDDPECGMGGTIAKLTRPWEEGKNVTEREIFVYITLGQVGFTEIDIKNKTVEERATIRRQEATNSAKLLKAEPIFMGLMDGACQYENPQPIIDKLENLIRTETPRAIFCPWPVDNHADHRFANYCASEPWVRIAGRGALLFPSLSHPEDYDWDATQDPPMLFYWQTAPGRQSLEFEPYYYVNIEGKPDEWKRKALAAHACQNTGDKLITGWEQVIQFNREKSGKNGVFEGFMSPRRPI